jgi:hypothetical protein
MRYERKYRIEHATWQEVQAVLHRLPLSFQLAYPDRFINSIYLDSPSLHTVQDNLSGISSRSKFRVRWYGEDLESATKPILEKKIKSNQLGTKEHSPLPDFQLADGFDFVSFLLENSPACQLLSPVVLVRYLRSYYVSFDGQVRATIDRGLQYLHFHGNIWMKNSALHDPAVILEIKYDEKLDGQLDEMFQSLPFRLSKNSKFVGGLFGFY